MLLAKLYLNAGVYIGADQSSLALSEVERVIGGPYSLATDYQLNFLADNRNSPEIIRAVAQDGDQTRTWGGLTFLIHAAVGGNMNAGDFGIDGGWWGIRVLPELVAQFPGGAASLDGRALFFTDGQNLEVANISNFNDGYAGAKFKNVSSLGVPGAHPTFPDTDFPVFRLADAYLMYAEAHLRGGGGTAATAVGYVNELLERAYGDQSANITAGELTLDFILGERARELWWEGHRRTDLIRYGLFTTGDYLWSWKGGSQAGVGVADRFEPVSAAGFRAAGEPEPDAEPRLLIATRERGSTSLEPSARSPHGGRAEMRLASSRPHLRLTRTRRANGTEGISTRHPGRSRLPPHVAAAPAGHAGHPDRRDPSHAPRPGPATALLPLPAGPRGSE